MTELQTLTYLARHLTRRTWLATSRSRQLVARECVPVAQMRERQAASLFDTVWAARRLPAYAALPEPPRGEAIFGWLGMHCPIVSKPDLVAGRARYYPGAGVRKPWWPLGKTSGTSGSPLEIFRSIDSVIWEEAFNLQFWHWAGYRPGDPQAVLRGDQVVPLQQSHAPFWRWDPFGRQLFLSTRHVRSDTVLAFVRAVQHAGAQMMRAYPSSSFELARLCEQLGVKLTLRAVITGSEPLYPLQREQLERSFGCKVFDFYGMAERVAYAAQCEHGHYHLNPEYSFVEIVDEAGRPTDGFGSVVGTTFHNTVMPLLRYRLSDRARWLPGVCACGRTYPRMELASGKVEDQLFDRDGHAVSASVITFAFKGLANIRKSQVAQIGRGAWEVRVVPDPGFSERDSAAVVANIANHVSDRVTVQVRVVEDIALLPSGKFKWVSQEYQRPSAGNKAGKP